jgi:hypothetical protein
MRAGTPIYLAVIAGLGALGCGDDTDYLVVTVDAQPAVHDARAGTTRTDRLAIAGGAFPVTFSISAPGRQGELAIAIDAEDDDGLIVGNGSATAMLGNGTAAVHLEPTDFVVNTDFAGDQFPASDFEASGFQLAALPTGAWTAVFRDDTCPADACSLFARRFDATGRPSQTVAAAGTNAFAINLRPTTRQTTPSIASGPGGTVAVWDQFDLGTAANKGVSCRAIAADGSLGADQKSLTTDPTEAADVVSVASLPSGNFVATWKTVIAATSLDAIRMVTLGSDCTALGAVQTVALGAAVADVVHRGSVAAGGDGALFAWITNGDLHVRPASAAGAFTGADTALLKATATEQIEHARVAALPGGGYAVAVRWALKSGTTGTNRIELLRLTAAGAAIGDPVLVTDRSGNDFDSSESFAIASRADAGADQLLIAWHTCGGLGDDSQCGVFGRLLRREPAADRFAATGDAFTIPTTTIGDQRRPSLTALPDGFAAMWSDTSARPPDTAGQAVRARILYPPVASSSAR